VSSPGSSADAITVAAAAIEGARADMAGFSSAGPTPLSLRLKPDVTAPGVSILSSVPGADWSTSSGTSMAAPHVAGGAALLLQRHPDWTPAQVKGAVVGTARPLRPGELEPPTRAGAGFLDLVAADVPLVTASPTSVSFRHLTRGALLSQDVALADAGGGAGTWSVAVDVEAAPAGTVVSAPASVTVPGTIELTALAGGADGEAGGVVRLTREGVVRRIPFWLRVSTPALAGAATRPLPRPGTYAGDTRGKPALAATYRYPEVPAGGPVNATLAGPEQLFRFSVRRRAANVGVVITSRGKGVRVEPRVIAAGDENRLAGYAALPFNLNPYLVDFGEPTLAAGVLHPATGAYDVVFDSPTAAGAGAFTFRFWVDDVTPPTARLLKPSVPRRTPIRIRVTDAGSGVDRSSILVTVDGVTRPVTLSGGVIRIGTSGLARGRHRLRLQVSDYQETRNMENVARILPNTRVLRTVVTIR
jgi:hypothetical protein